MTKVEEFMIGDWVMSIHPAMPRPIKVTEIGKNDIGYKNGILHISFIEPIPITPEILERNGFRLKEEGESYTEYVSGDEHSIIALVFYKESIYDVDTVLDCELGFFGGLNRIHHCHVKFVHELQHALKLCGISKNIEL